MATTPFMAMRATTSSSAAREPTSCAAARASARRRTARDRYVWSRGDGDDKIVEYGKSLTETDVLDLTDILSSEVTLTRADGNDDLYIEIGPDGETITVEEQYQNVAFGYGLEKILFADGNVWDRADIVRWTTVDGTSAAETIRGLAYDDNLYGHGGNDTLIGAEGDDYLDGGAGADSLVGDAGHDRYVWSTDDGNDTIVDASTTAGEIDTLELRDVAAAGAELSRSGNHLAISIAGSETIEVRDRFHEGAANRGVEIIEFADGVRTRVLDDAVAVLEHDGTTADDDLRMGWAFKDVIRGHGGDDTIDAKGGEDTIDGGSGDDSLRGGTGADTYLWTSGEGDDTIDDAGTSRTERDVLVFSDIASDDVILTRTNGSRDLVITFEEGRSDEELRIVNRFHDASRTATASRRSSSPT